VPVVPAGTATRDANGSEQFQAFADPASESKAAAKSNAFSIFIHNFLSVAGLPPNLTKLSFDAASADPRFPLEGALLYPHDITNNSNNFRLKVARQNKRHSPNQNNVSRL
jgi:hypothetical protein